MMVSVILLDIRSAYNVGSIFRTADAMGVDRVYCTGYTPTPVDRFGRVQPEIQKTSLGASETVPWEHVDDIGELLARLRQEEVSVVAVEQHSRATHLDTWTSPEWVALLFGNEVDGLPEAACSSSDVIVEIPMHGKKESLNVSVVAGIVLYHVRAHRGGATG